MSRNYDLPWHIPRWLPDDFRHLNYRIAAYLLNKARLRQMTGRGWQSYHWAGQTVQNLTESIVDIAKRGELASLRNIGGVMQAEIEALIQKGQVD